MNKLVLNPKGRNHFRFLPLKNRELPKDEKEQIQLVESLYNDLVNKGIVLYTKSKSGSYSVKAVQLNDNYFIVVSLSNEFKTYNNTIYETSTKNDALAISNFIGKNITTMMADYKKQILDAKDMVVRKEVKDEGNTIDVVN